MTRFIFDAFLKPALAMAFFLGFGGFFVFGGFQSSDVMLERGAANKVNGTLTRSHFLGLYTVTNDLKGVREATIETRRTGRGSLARSYSVLISGVVLVSDSGETPLFWGFSNIDDREQREIKTLLNRYIQGKDVAPFKESFVVRNLFGWVGLPFFLIGVFGVLSWPMIVVSAWRKSG